MTCCSGYLLDGSEGKESRVGGSCDVNVAPGGVVSCDEQVGCE